MPAFEPHVGRNPNTPKIAPLRKFIAEAGAENRFEPSRLQRGSGLNNPRTGNGPWI